MPTASGECLSTRSNKVSNEVKPWPGANRVKHRASIAATTMAMAILFLPAAATQAHLNVGDVIGADQAAEVADLVSPGNMFLVKQGMTMKIVPSGQLEWPTPYRVATEQYSSQVRL